MRGNGGGSTDAVSRQHRYLPTVGAILVGVSLYTILYMFAMRPIISEEEEIVRTANRKARAWAVRGDWIDANVLYGSSGAKEVILHVSQLLHCYRMRLFVFVEEAQLSSLSAVLFSLQQADYSQRPFPVDVEVHVWGSSEAVPRTSWRQGRFDVYTHTLHRNSKHPIELSLKELWHPRSSFELGMVISAPTIVSPYWFTWLISAIKHYVSPSNETSITLRRDTNGQLESPLSDALHGIALGLPVAGKTLNAVTSVLSAYPSTVTVFTASCWNLLAARIEPNTNESFSSSSWKALLKAAVTVKEGDPELVFLYPALVQFGPLVCEDVNACLFPAVRTHHSAGRHHLPPSKVKMPPQWPEESA